MSLKGRLDPDSAPVTQSTSSIQLGLPVLQCSGAETVAGISHMGRKAARGLFRVKEHLSSYPVLSPGSLYDSSQSVAQI